MARKKAQKTNAQMLRTGPGRDPRKSLRIGRNDDCPCGSGRKYKDCHQNDGDLFLQKIQRQQEKEELKRKGVPWYKRIFLG